MSVTTDQIRHVFPNCPDPEVQAGAYNAAFKRWGMDRKNARAGAFGIIGNETGGTLSPKAETSYFNTPWSRVAQVFPGVIGLNEQVYNSYKALGREGFDKAFFNHVYDDRRRPPRSRIGNNTQDGDGYAFRGVGPIQLTGRDNCEACAKDHGMSVGEFMRRVVVEPHLAASSAIWFLVKRAKLLTLLGNESQADFITAANIVGRGDGANTTARRLEYRRLALEVVLPAGAVKDESGNVTIANIEDSTIIRDGNRGQTVTGIVGVVGGTAPVLTTVAGMPWQTAAVIGAFVLAGAGLAIWYFQSTKGARRNLHKDGVA